ncbi:hypothetical protein EXW96_20845 [Paenibacillus sp. JMULE4]|uniref:DUF5348 domain-containing protein n=1 Tax=Paenibacillus sp. JMULE4 TaxID=2518342 RepID=UPI0015771529|nr:DUF5348 domain-containing protein [Paenibacillus sp. JMULE4]NTZ16429.1 hypothetical protein [Paenibacillus sp. JMULE4]NTZ19905.1 hypothetical protein [Paenibacillus sp. JMULE4]
MRKRETIRYDADRDVWCVPTSARPSPLHCGECFTLYVGSKAYECRLELDTDWYVLMQDTKFVLHRRTVYAVSL